MKTLTTKNTLKANRRGDNPRAWTSEPRQSADEGIAEAAAAAISWITTVPPEGIHITVRRGRVRLDGAVDYWHQSETIESLVRHVTGVRAVTNLMIVRDSIEQNELLQSGPRDEDRLRSLVSKIG